MKHALMCLLFLVAVTSRTHAQPYSFYLSIPDNSIITSVSKGVGTVTPTFNDPNINAIIGNYVVSGFNKAFPTSKYECLRNVYRISVDDSALLSDLRGYDSTLFPSYAYKDTVRPLSFTPDDWSLLPGFNMGYLDFIKARDAWDGTTGTQGDSNVVIGICDNYFDTGHPDLSAKIAFLGPNGQGQGAPDHGTAVAGYAAAGTHNSIGVPAIGFRCKLDLESMGNGVLDDSVMLNISKRGRKIVNASFEDPSSYTLNPPFIHASGQFIKQLIYNEIYENGTMAVCGGGQATSNSRYFVYPASFDHNISVTSVGWRDTDTLTPGKQNAVWVHDRYTNDSSFFNHNTKIDLCAPGIDLCGLTYDPNDPSKHWLPNAAIGTSFAAPLVSGTAGLMLSVKGALTPYQMEYILKKQANSYIYNVSWNQRYKGTTPYNGRIGVGALDAAAAIGATRDFIVDNPTTKTFIIKSVKITHKCLPGLVSGMPVPQLTVELENGTPPYSYKWEVVAGNKCNVFPTTGSGITTNSFTATIPGTLGAPYVFYYYLTVYDASDIQKVAHKAVKFTLIDDANKWDLIMRDAYEDTYNERNDMDKVNAKNWNIWESPDLWVRQLQDSIAIPQNPEYTQGVNNYIYARVRNVGCAASPTNDSSRIHLYWTIASTGETWDDDWIGNTPVNGQTGGGLICSKPLPPINPGRDTLVECAWQPPNPFLYDTAADIEVCVLGRITMQNAANQGMTFAEDTLVKENIWNNNNIVTRNLVVTNFVPGTPPPKGTVIVVGNASNTPGTFTLQVVTGQQIEPYLHGSPGEYLTGALQLGELYDVWVNGGREGNATSYEDGTKTVYFDLQHPLRLANLEMGGMEKYPVKVFMELNGNAVPFAVEDQRVWIRQLIERIDSVDNGDGTKFAMTRDEVYGAVGFAINIQSDEETEGKQSHPFTEETRQEFAGYPNPSSDNYTILSLNDENRLSSIVIVDISGRTVFSRKNVSLTAYKYQIRTSGLQPGVYFIKMVDSKGRQHSLKFMKTE